MLLFPLLYLLSSALEIQRYEAASTLFGPHTLAAYQQEFTKLVQAMAQNQTSIAGPSPPDLSYVNWCLAECDRGPDGHPSGKPFGTVDTDVLSSYSAGSTATVSFWGGNPDHNFMTQSTYLTVDRNVNGNWVTEYVDAHWETKMHWKREHIDYSLITVDWEIPSDVTPGQYRITHSGYSKSLTGRLHPYTGTSSTFTVTA